MFGYVRCVSPKPHSESSSKRSVRAEDALSPTRKQERSRAGILAAARALLLEKGPDELSLREVAARAGYSPASLYEYFDGREAILAAVAQEIATRLHTRLASVPEALPPDRRLVRLGQVYLAFGRENPNDYRLLFGMLRSGRSSHQAPMQSGSPFTVVYKTVVDGVSQGIFHTTAELGAHELSYGLWALVHGMITLQTTHLSNYQADFEWVDRELLEAFVRGFSRGR